MHQLTSERMKPILEHCVWGPPTRQQKEPFNAILTRPGSYKFESRRHVAAFLGLAPAPFASGDVSRDQGISKAGNRSTRVQMVELAWCWLKYQPSSELTVWYRNRFKGNGARAAKVGIVALARKLLIALALCGDRSVLKVPSSAPPDAYVATGSIRRRGLV
ncbi:MAG: transposase [Novosphingobium sp.]